MSDARRHHLTAPAVVVLALAAAVATSTGYVLQPELAVVAHDLDSPGLTGTIAALPIVGYLIGLATLVPLADRIRATRLVPAQLGVLGVGLVIASIAADPWTLGGGLFVSGACASTGAQLSSIAGRHSTDATRGRTVGAVTAGISAGIVLGRLVGGALADWLGWRGMLAVVAVACVVLAAITTRVLPSAALQPAESYPAVLRGLPRLVVNNRRLRGAAVSGALWFFAFSLIWVAVSLALAQPPLNLSSAAIGLYALAGLLGVAATRTAGVLADRHGARVVILSGLGLAAACTVAMSVSLAIAPVLLAGLALFDAGLFAAQVANQSRVLSIDPDRSAQFNGAYMVVYFVGGSMGTAVGGSLVDAAGWTTAALVATGAIAVAAVLVTATIRRSGRPGRRPARAGPAR